MATTAEHRLSELQKLRADMADEEEELNRLKEATKKCKENIELFQMQINQIAANGAQANLFDGEGE